MKHLRAIAVVLGLAAYAVAFYAAPLPSVPDDAGRPLRRFDLLVQLLAQARPVAVGKLVRHAARFFVGRSVAHSAGGRGDRGLGNRLGLAVAAALPCGRGAQSRGDGRLRYGCGAQWFEHVDVAIGSVRCDGPSVGLLPAGDADTDRRRRCLDQDPRAPTGRGGGPDRQSRPDGPHERSMALAGRSLPPGHLSGCHAATAGLRRPRVPPASAKEFFQQGRITFLPHNVYANMTLGTEMLSLLGMVLTGNWWLGALVGKTVIAAFTPLTAVGLLLAGRRLFSPAAGVVAALVYISVPWVVSIAAGGLVEGASACYLFLAVYALLLASGEGAAVQQSSWKGNWTALPHRSRRGGSATAAPTPVVGAAVVLPPLPSRSFSLLALAGYLAGAAVATKYPAALFVLLPLAFWIVFRQTGPSAKQRWKATTASLGIYLLAAALACGLWFGENWALSGNPTYPLLYQVFDGKSWNAAKEQQWNRVHRPHDFSPQALGHDLGQVAIGSEWLSPLLVPLAVLAFVGGGCRCGLRWQLLAYAGFVIAVWWLATHRIDRFWIPVLPVVALLAGAGTCWNLERWWRRLLAGLLVAGLAANFLLAAGGQANAWFVSLAQLRDAPEWIDPWHAYLNHHVREGRVLLVGDAAVST